MRRRSIFLLNDTGVTGHPGCVTVMAIIRNNLEKRGIQVAGSWPVGLDWKFGLVASRKFRAASAFIINGEGTIHDSKTRSKARRLLELAKYLKRSRTGPVFLINATVENIDARDFENFRSFDRIFVRDSQSRSYLQEHGIGADHVPDLCLSADFDSPVRTGGPVVTDSVMPCATAALKNYSADVGACFLPMRPPKLRSYLQWALHAGAQTQDAGRYYAAIAGAEFVVTGRFHAALFCILAGTPFLAVASNTQKIQSALRDIFGTTSRMIGCENLKQIGSNIPALTDHERQQAQSYIASARDRSRNMFDQIAAAKARPALELA